LGDVAAGPPFVLGAGGVGGVGGGVPSGGEWGGGYALLGEIGGTPGGGGGGGGEHSVGGPGAIPAPARAQPGGVRGVAAECSAPRPSGCTRKRPPEAGRGASRSPRRRGRHRAAPPARIGGRVPSGPSGRRGTSTTGVGAGDGHNGSSARGRGA